MGGMRSAVASIRPLRCAAFDCASFSRNGTKFFHFPVTVVFASTAAPAVCMPLA